MEKRTDLLSVFGAGWWIAPVVVAASLGTVAYLTADDEPPTYASSATLAVVPHPSVNDENQVMRILNILEERTIVSTLSRIPTSAIIRQRAAEGMGVSLDELDSYRVDTSILPSTYLVRVTVRGPDPELAQRFAEAIANRSEPASGRFYRVLAFRLVDPATMPEGPVDSGERRSYAVAGVLGLFLGVGSAFGVGMLRLA